jgi:hypothetical protein
VAGRKDAFKDVKIRPSCVNTRSLGVTIGAIVKGLGDGRKLATVQTVASERLRMGSREHSNSTDRCSIKRMQRATVVDSR